RFLADHGIRGNAFNQLEIGGLLLWTQPGEKNFIDSRNLSDSLGREYYSLLLMQSGFEEKLNHYGVDYMVFHPFDLLTSPQIMKLTLISYCSTHRDTWKLVYWDDHSMLYLKDVPKFREVIDKYEYKL